MPIVKQVIGGREYSFAPLLVGDLRKMKRSPIPEGNLERIDFWLPFIESCIKRAGSEMPDFDAMDLDQATEFFKAATAAVTQASGAHQGEEQPAAEPPAIGTTSSVSS